MSYSNMKEDDIYSRMELGEDSAFGSYAAIPEVPYGDASGLTDSEKLGRATLESGLDPSTAQTARSAAAEASAQKIKPRHDMHLWGTFLFLVFFSVVEIFSASSQEVKIDNIYGPVIRHAIFLAIGVAIVVWIQRTHFRFLYRYIPLYVVVSVLMMVMVLFAGVKINGTMRGLQVGPFTVLPAEFLKLAVVLGVAWILSRNQDKNKRDVTKRGAVQATVLTIGCAGLLVSHGLSNAILVVAMSLAMMLIGGMAWKKWFRIIAVLASLALVFYVGKKIVGSNTPVSPKAVIEAKLNHDDAPTSGGAGRMSTWHARIDRYLTFDKYKQGITEENRQEQYSYIAQAHGGLWGVGIGNSRENTRLPLAFSDYIYAIIIEEWGMIAGLFILLCYLWILVRAGRIGAKCSSSFACLIVCGCGVFIVTQALYHMAIVTGVAPVSGQPLPLISKGGTSIIVTCMAIGCMLSVSGHAAFKNDLMAKKREFASLPESIRNENPLNTI